MFSSIFTLVIHPVPYVLFHPNNCGNDTVFIHSLIRMHSEIQSPELYFETASAP